MDANLRRQQNAIVNATPLPVADPTTDVLDTIPLADQPEPQQEAPQQEDDNAWMTGGTFQVKSQAEWDALPLERQEVIRAAVAMGGALPVSDAMKIYQDSRKQRMEAIPQEVVLPDGTKTYSVNGQIVNPVDLKTKEMDLQLKMGQQLEQQRRRAEEIGSAKANLENIRKYREYVKVPGIVGPIAGARQMADAVLNPDAYAKRRELEVMANTSVMQNLQNFKGSISNAEREFLQKMFPRINEPAEVWDNYFNSAEEIFKRGTADAPSPEISSNGKSVAPAASYSSPVDVRAAYKAGKISRDEALRMISGMGGK